MDGQTARSGVDENFLDVQLHYACDLGLLGELAERFVPSQLDAEGEAFLAAALRRRHGRTGYWAQRVLTLFLSDFDANALLGSYPVFLLSTPQALRLIEVARPLGVSTGRWLDIGAGSGDVTTRLAPLVEELSCTEASHHMARRLRRRGFSCWVGQAGEGAPGDPLAQSGQFDVISLLNVLDRTARPRSLLARAVQQLPPQGLLMLSVPLPYDPFYYAGASTRDPLEPLQVKAARWEDALGELWRHELAPLGLELRALTRLPYLSGGDVQHPAYVLDDALLVCEKP
jgi:SAM-dependent methyltransferase